jgi:hypothetical protein
MSKKIMLLALAVAALFALPSAASAEEIHFTNVTTFSGTGGPGALQAVGEPKISCSATKVENGKFDTGSSTTGSMDLHFTGCAAEFLGIKGNCNTSGAASGTIKAGGTFHLITFVNSKSEKKPAILVTPATTTIICIGFSRVDVTGSIIGTIESPACGTSSTIMKVVFNQAAGKQEHLLYTGKEYDLIAHTENSAGELTGASGTAGLEGTVTLTSPTSGTLDCT